MGGNGASSCFLSHSKLPKSAITTIVMCQFMRMGETMVIMQAMGADSNSTEVLFVNV